MFPFDPPENIRKQPLSQEMFTLLIILFIVKHFFQKKKTWRSILTLFITYAKAWNISVR